MPTSISGSAPLSQCYESQLNSDEGAGGGSSVGYEGGSRGVGNIPPSHPPDQTDDRCFGEQGKAMLACGKLVAGFDLPQATTCIMELANLTSCLTAHTETSEP